MYELVTGVAVFDGLPTTVKLEDSEGPGTLVANVTVNCTSSSAFSASLKNISPTTSFFNPVNYLTTDATDVRLSPSAFLDARQVSQYTLTLSAQCMPTEPATEAKLSIELTRTDRLNCSSSFSGTGDVVQVSEDVAPGTVIYSTVVKKPGISTLTFSIEDASMLFNITTEGRVMAPATGFTREQAGKTFSMKIVVKGSDGTICHRPLSVRVMPVYHNKVNFTESSVAVSVLENQGPLQDITTVHASGENVIYQIISPVTDYFTIDPENGVIKNTYNLDLQRSSGLAQTQLLVKAYNMLHPSDSATITVNITVQQKNLQGPVCTPAILVAEIPENTPVGWTLSPWNVPTCWDAESGNNTLHYQMEDGQNPPYSFRIKDKLLQLNTTLDCDSEVMASRNFQYQAAILVTDNGSPQQTTRVPVLVTAGRVNEFAPQCSQRTFTIPENAAFGALVGNVNGTDRDYPFNNIEYSILGAPTAFYIGRRTGELQVLQQLDYEKEKSYRLTILLHDLDNGAGSRKSTLCNITINVQDVNDWPPVCKPPFQLHSICSTVARTESVTQLQCEDKDERSELSYNIIGGNTNGRFRMVGSSLFPNTFSYNPDGILDPPIFELLVKVTDSRSEPQFSTTAIVVVHVVQCPTTAPTTTTTTTMTVSKKPIILHRTEEYWAPDPWFVVVLTVTGALFLSALGLLFWHLCWRKAPAGKISQPLLQNRGKGLERNNIITEEPNKDKGKGSATVLSLEHQFDGRAQDPVTGQYYLFDTSTGARRWV
ncbi:cadherin-related family member 4 [Hemicordylus capensis]|uniref:cadherin-related family member 4 n=1 Tax=Hemicordylus capensis TaxID=884348 RepID=UPI002302EC89|nr:cadherin-related family member 4 [Hemicordylus capensis]